MINQSAKFYGAAHLIGGEKLNKSILRASWVHGADLAFHDYKHASLLIHPHEFGLNIRIVSNKEQEKYPGHTGEYDLISAGVPFIYTNPKYSSHHGGLHKRTYVPRHGIAKVHLNNLYQKWMETALKNKCDSILLNAFDYENFKKMINYENSNIKIIEGANIKENITLLKIRDIFYSIEECVFDSPGSHIIYAILCGCKSTFIEEDIEIHNRNKIINECVKGYPKFIRDHHRLNLLSRHEGSEFTEKWSKYNLSELREIAEHEAGVEFKRKNEFIEKLIRPINKLEEVKISTNIILSKLQHKIFDDIFFH